jgi:hypothetical protein
MKNLKFKEIYPNILVYENPFDDLEGLLNIIIDSEKNPKGSMIVDWKDWYVFGIETSNFSNEIDDSDRVKKEKLYIKNINDVFYLVTKDYAKQTGIEFIQKKVKSSEETLQEPFVDLWKKMGPSICKYFPNSGISDNMAMNYHTDYQFAREERRGYNFFITATMYLNDNYDGGEIEFFINNTIIRYKPKAGDVVVFPAGDPKFLTKEGSQYIHGVRKVFNGEKYFIRNHWNKYFDGSPEWHANLKKYGLEKWQEIEKQKEKEDYKNGRWQIITEQDTVNCKIIDSF